MDEENRFDEVFVKCIIAKSAFCHSYGKSQVKYSMNIAFTALTLISLVILTATTPATAFPTMIEGVRNAILLILKLTAIYAVWLSVLRMMQATGLDQKLSRGLRPIVRRLFKHESDEAYKWISINLASNMLGMGGAATPAGINAMNAMCPHDEKATDNMILLLVINATSIQLIPAAVIALRATAGSENAASIFAPTLISTFFSTLIGVILCKLFSKHVKEPDASTQRMAPFPSKNFHSTTIKKKRIANSTIFAKHKAFTDDKKHSAFRTKRSSSVKNKHINTINSDSHRKIAKVPQIK